MICKARTESGKRCKNPRLSNSEYCRLHTPIEKKNETALLDLAFTDALYYPFIEIPDETWLKTAVLYWNSISTIVPESITPYTGGAAKLLHEANILSPLTVCPEMPELRAVANDVYNYINTDEGKRVLLLDNKKPDFYIHNEKFWHMLKYRLRRADALHLDKLAPDLLRFLAGKKTRERDWIRVPASFAGYYMTLMATHLANSKGKALLTDKIASERLASKAVLGDVTSQDRPVRISRNIAEGLIAETVFKTIDIGADTSIKKLIKFREKNDIALGQFRTAMRKLFDGFSASLTSEALSSYIGSIYRDNVVPAVEILRGKLKDHRISLGINNLKASTLLSASPTAIGVVAANLGLGPFALVAGIGVSVVIHKANYNIKRKEILTSNPYSYLLIAEKYFGARKTGKK